MKVVKIQELCRLHAAFVARNLPPMATAAAAYASLTRQTSRAALQSALKASDYKDLLLWAALIRHDVLAAAGGPAQPGDAAEPWRALGRLAESCIVNNRDALKAAPALYLAVTLDHTRAQLRAGAVSDAKRTLGSLRSVASAKFSWEFFKLLAIIECRQGAWCGWVRGCWQQHVGGKGWAWVCWPNGPSCAHTHTHTHTHAHHPAHPHSPPCAPTSSAACR